MKLDTSINLLLRGFLGVSVRGGADVAVEGGDRPTTPGRGRCGNDRWGLAQRSYAGALRPWSQT
jgi:hypothetical protein